MNYLQKFSLSENNHSLSNGTFTLSGQVIEEVLCRAGRRIEP